MTRERYRDCFLFSVFGMEAGRGGEREEAREGSDGQHRTARTVVVILVDDRRARHRLEKGGLNLPS